MTDGAHVVVGGGPAALAAADSLGRAGAAVRLHLPDRGIGAGFRPLTIEGRHLPLGFRVLELVVDQDHPRTPPPWSEYEPSVHGHRNWLGLLEDWFRELVGDELRELSRPEMVLDGRRGPDIYYCVDPVNAVAIATAADIGTIAREASKAADELGAAGPFDLPEAEHWNLDFDTVSRQTHGERFHELFIEGPARKVTADGIRDVSLALRRKPWMPLFWPSTLAEAFSGATPRWRPTHRRFHDCGRTNVVDELLARLEASADVTIIRSGPLLRVRRSGDRTSLRFADGTEVSATRPILAVSAEELFAAAGAEYRPERHRVVVAWVEADEADVVSTTDCLMPVDGDDPVFRISTGGRPAEGAVLFTVELSHVVDAGAAGSVALDGLERLGLIRPGTGRLLHAVAGPGPQRPTRTTHRQWRHAASRFRERELRAWVLGGAGTFGADSLNEQIAQGLWAAELSHQGAAPPANHEVAAI
ncbi:MAG: hypothetical protein AAGA17_06945 [Actinomycetota bacterium]